jgi:NitT/TauT family transport system substrate-binding protein
MSAKTGWLRVGAIVCGFAALAQSGAPTPAAAAETVTYLFPAPPSLPAFGPIQVARARGYFQAEGIEFKEATARGGVDAAKQIGAGNALVGGVLGDTPIIVRANDVPVRAVALFGGQGFMQLVAREDAGINSPADLKGKTITALSFQDTTFYALLGVLRSVGLKQADVDAQAAGPTGVWQLVATGKAHAMAGVPDWIPPIEQAGVKVKIMPGDRYFPTMAQAIGASDTAIRDKPAVVRGVVRASLKGMKDIMTDPAGAAADFAKFVPGMTGKDDYIAAVFRYYASLVYPGQKTLGEFNPDRVAKLQDFYLESGIIQKKTPVAELFTNQFVQ